MTNISKPKKNKINPNEFGGMMFNSSEIKAVKDVIINEKIFRYSGKYKTKTDKFESMSSEFFGRKYSLGVNNGTSGLKLALIAIGVGKGDKVLISSYTFIATAAAVIALGAIPVPIDFDFETCLNIEDLNKEINKGCKAIIAVHLQGRSFNLEKVVSIAKLRNIPLIEDACQSFGARYNNTYAGCFGNIGIFSFQQNKQLTCGEGGLLITDTEEYYKKARNFADHGAVRDTEVSWDKEDSSIGDNLRMNNIQAAIMIEQIKKFNEIKLRQIRNREYIMNKTRNSNIKSIINSSDPYGDTGMNILFLTNSNEDALKVIDYAKNQTIEFRFLWHRIYYTFRVILKLHLDPKSLGKGDCKVAEDIAKRLISISIPPMLSKSELNLMVNTILYLKNSNYIN